MLLDELLPEYDVRASYGTRVAASPERVYASLRTANFNLWGLTRALFALRSLPSFLVAPRETRDQQRAKGQPHTGRLDDLLARGFSLLGERPGEELVLGTAGRFWLARVEIEPMSPSSFREVGVPGTAKAA